jgi:cell division protease FtsH
LLERSLYRGEQVSFDDIIGHEGAKRELAVVAEGFRRQAAALSLGLTLVKGVIIMGPPGTGKTMLAKALASSVGRPAYILPSAEMTPASLRHLYEALSGIACVVIWDEIQCLISAFADDKTIAAFCAALDGVQPSAGPITIGLTATPEYRLDDSAIRSGRLTTKVTIVEPDLDDRRELWAAATRATPVMGELDLDAIAEATEGFTGADITSTVSVALGLSMVEGVDALTPAVLDEAIGRDNHVTERPESTPPPPVDQWAAAIHEAGHAVYAALVWGPASVSETRLLSEGYPSPGTMSEPPDGVNTSSRACLRQKVEIAFAGTVAEELIFGIDGATTGNHHDLRQATSTIQVLVGHGGALNLFPAVSIDTFENGMHSDRGSEEMRSWFFRAVVAEAGRALAEVRLRLAGHEPVITKVARALHDDSARRITQPRLGELLREGLSDDSPDGGSATESEPDGARLLDDPRVATAHARDSG